jgi:hypothetical protein
MEVLENTENDLQIDHQTIDCYVITLTSEIRKLRTHYATNPLNIGMYVNFPCPAEVTEKRVEEDVTFVAHGRTIKAVPRNLEG